MFKTILKPVVCAVLLATAGASFAADSIPEPVRVPAGHTVMLETLGVSYIQRLETKGGVAPAAACDMATKGAKQQVAYQAKYVFYKQS